MGKAFIWAHMNPSLESTRFGGHLTVRCFFGLSEPTLLNRGEYPEVLGSSGWKGDSSTTLGISQELHQLGTSSGIWLKDASILGTRVWP